MKNTLKSAFMALLLVFAIVPSSFALSSPLQQGVDGVEVQSEQLEFIDVDYDLFANLERRKAELQQYSFKIKKGETKKGREIPNNPGIFADITYHGLNNYEPLSYDEETGKVIPLPPLQQGYDLQTCREFTVYYFGEFEDIYLPVDDLYAGSG